MLLPYYLIPGTVLPTDIEGEPAVWQSSLPGAVDPQGNLVAPWEGMSAEFQLTATASSRTYSFSVRMMGSNCYWLAGYTRKPDADPNVRSLFVAKSLHLALSKNGNDYEALNSNYGVLFAAADYSRSVAGETQLLEQPRMFRLADHGFGILAIPLNHQGQENRPGELLYFETQDLVRYEEKGRLRLTESAIMDFSCQLDAETLRYRISWIEESGESSYTTTQNFIHLDPPRSGEMNPVMLCQVPLGDDVEAAQCMALTSSEAAYLRNKLGRVRNIAIDVPTIRLCAGDSTLNLDTVRVTARYSDGSSALKRLTLDEAETAELDLSKPGEYTLRARVVRKRFPYPMMRTRPDPYVLHWKGRYYFIATDDDGQRKIHIRSADTLEGLEDGRSEEVLLWDGNVPDGERHGQHWAPELHVIGGKLYSLLAISVNNEWHGVQAHMALLKGEDPMIPEHWDTPRRVLDRHGKALTDLAKREHSISLDMTYFEHNGKSYVCWSEPKWFGEQQERASLYLAAVDPAKPWQLTSEPVQIARNEYGWDRNGGIASGVAEGPFVLKRGDTLYMAYSGSNVSPNYTVGLLAMSAEADPMNPASWTKSNYPVMHSNSLPDQYGPGHNMFVQDRYGDWYNVYHACGVTGGFRHASISPLHFRVDGTPVLDMREDEELLPELERVTLTVLVE
ncbi:GH43 family beta-xylosidase [Paenibacillus phyllosphaerae]|uniref:GH43 family beta-xylosidase n=1 Tax=Paenibacillus phyllosphaerae TaxID=274593 RepID=A0A7W5B2G9_9BACL|nr:family 43 glycosylhydrolase [Paenibacillus phyllosphaerae]MBB3113123.1 GH43 family beta-xylosidase [Paenibacillus phyllosphaerae]